MRSDAGIEHWAPDPRKMQWEGYERQRYRNKDYGRWRTGKTSYKDYFSYTDIERSRSWIFDR